MDKKKCTRCGETKPITDFYRRRGDIYYSACKDCHDTQKKKRRARKKQPKKIVSNEYVLGDFVCF